MAILAAACHRGPLAEGVRTTVPSDSPPPTDETEFVWPEAPNASLQSAETRGSLSLPPPYARLRAVVYGFFGAVSAESVAELSRCLTPGAVVLDENGRTAPALAAWKERLDRWDFDSLPAPLVIDPDELLVLSPAATDPRRPPRLPRLEPTEQLVLAVPRPVPAGTTRLFGERLWFVLTPQQRTWRIRAIVEDVP